MGVRDGPKGFAQRTIIYPLFVLFKRDNRFYPMAGPENIEVIVGMGSNLGDREKNILRGAEAMDEEDDIHLQAVSPVYESEPLGPSTQPFFNAAALIHTSLKPAALLKRLKEIEKICGRKPSKTWGAPRTLDLDILLYGNKVVNEKNITVPHPDLIERDFALRPLLDLKPGARHPSSSRPLAEELEKAKYRTITSPPMPLPVNVNYILLEHTADIGVEAKAGSLQDLLETCAMALSDIIVDRALLRETQRHNCKIEGSDFHEALVGLLQEVIYLLDVKNFLPRRVSVKLKEKGKTPKISAAFFGNEITGEEVKMAVKAATYHMIEIDRISPEPEVWKARVYFDV